MLMQHSCLNVDNCLKFVCRFPVLVGEVSLVKNLQATIQTAGPEVQRPL